MLIIKNGTTSFDPPVGTGPFKLESFTPGQRSKSVRHDGYWMEGKPYLDSIEIISIDDPGARLNALAPASSTRWTACPLLTPRRWATTIRP